MSCIIVQTPLNPLDVGWHDVHDCMSYVRLTNSLFNLADYSERLYGFHVKYDR